MTQLYSLTMECVGFIFQVMSEFGRVKNLRLVRDIGKFLCSILNTEPYLISPRLFSAHYFTSSNSVLLKNITFHSRICSLHLLYLSHFVNYITCTSPRS